VPVCLQHNCAAALAALQTPVQTPTLCVEAPNGINVHDIVSAFNRRYALKLEGKKELAGHTIHFALM
jgi:hypothetical protein